MRVVGHMKSMKNASIVALSICRLIEKALHFLCIKCEASIREALHRFAYHFARNTWYGGAFRFLFIEMIKLFSYDFRLAFFLFSLFFSPSLFSFPF